MLAFGWSQKLGCLLIGRRTIVTAVLLWEWNVQLPQIITLALCDISFLVPINKAQFSVD